MADRGSVWPGRWHLHRVWRSFLVGMALVGVSGCAPYGDGAADMYAHRKLMRATSAEYERGTELAGQTLVDTLSGRTLVYRYRAAPGSHGRDRVVYRYFRPDGRYVYVDTSLAFLKLESSVEGDYWKVTGPHLCVKSQLHSSVPLCYMVARAKDGAIQFYVDDPGGPYHDLLTAFTSEIIVGPPPGVR